MIGWITGKIAGSFGPYIIGGAVCIIALMGLSLSILANKYISLVSESSAKIERAQSNANQFEQTTKDQKAEIQKLLIDQAKEEVRTEYRNEQLALSQKSLDEERQKNDSYKTRWAKVANKKPGLLSRLANRATYKRVHFIASATCRAGCNEDGNTSTSGKATTETSADTPD